jgi:hypothetical protein
MNVKNGDRATLVLRPRADNKERTVTGTVRSFEQDGEIRWEISTGDPQFPAVGFDPKTAELREPE